MDAIAKGWFTELSPDDREEFQKAQKEVENSENGTKNGEEPQEKAWKYDHLGMGQAWPGQVSVINLFSK